MTGNAIQAFLTENQRLWVLKNIASHLNDHGLLVFETRLLEGYNTTEDSKYQFWERYIDGSGNNVCHFGKKQRFDQQTSILYFQMKRQYDGGHETYSAIEIKSLAQPAIKALSEIAGFSIQNRYSNWSSTPFDPTGIDGVYGLRKR